MICQFTFTITNSDRYTLTINKLPWDITRCVHNKATNVYLEINIRIISEVTTESYVSEKYLLNYHGDGVQWSCLLFI